MCVELLPAHASMAFYGLLIARGSWGFGGFFGFWLLWFLRLLRLLAFGFCGLCGNLQPPEGPTVTSLAFVPFGLCGCGHLVSVEFGGFCGLWLLVPLCWLWCLIALI